MLWNHSSIDSINQYYRDNVGRALLPPWPVEGKGNYAGSTRSSEPRSQREEEREKTWTAIKAQTRGEPDYSGLGVLLFAPCTRLIIGILWLSVLPVYSGRLIESSYNGNCPKAEISFEEYANVSHTDFRDWFDCNYNIKIKTAGENNAFG